MQTDCQLPPAKKRSLKKKRAAPNLHLPKRTTSAKVSDGFIAIPKGFENVAAVPTPSAMPDDAPPANVVTAAEETVMWRIR